MDSLWNSARFRFGDYTLMWAAPPVYGIAFERSGLAFGFGHIRRHHQIRAAKA
jgi:hypothetical protein